jgi:uncharacterized protein YoxC
MTNILKNPKNWALSLAVSVLAFGLALLLSCEAIAVPLTAAITRPVETAPAPVKNEFTLPDPLEKAKLTYERTVQKTNEVIEGLKAQLVAPSPNKNIIEDQQDDLENLADKFNDLSEKVGKLGKNLFYNSSSIVSETVQKNLLSLKQGLDNASETLDILADDTERAKKGASPFLKNRIDQGINAVQESLQTSDQAIKDLVSSIKAELQKQPKA